MTATLEVKLNHFPELLALLHEETKRVVAETAQRIEEGGKERVAVKTGSAKAGIYSITYDHDGYDEAAANAKSVNDKVGLAPKVDKPENEHVALVAGAVAHNIDLEYGTSHMGAQPYLTPAAEKEREAFETAMSRVLYE